MLKPTTLSTMQHYLESGDEHPWNDTLPAFFERLMASSILNLTSLPAANDVIKVALEIIAGCIRKEGELEDNKFYILELTLGTIE
jgi:hypothetical protein